MNFSLQFQSFESMINTVQGRRRRRTMTKKTLGPKASRRVVLFGWKLLVLLSLAFCLLALAFFNLHSSSSSSSPADWFDGPPKIAFLFVARRDLPLDFVWRIFFENVDVRNFSIYVHSAPGFVLDESTSRSHFFFGRQLSNSIQVGWGESSMIEAERLLLRTALQDPANQRFVLLSDSCVPLYNFSYIYQYLMSSPRSFVDSFRKENQYHPKMSPAIPKNKWRKGSQWITLIRSHAKVVVDDQLILPIFKRLCKRRPPPDAVGRRFNLKTRSKKQHNCIPDEHYVQTLLTMHALEPELERRTLTYSLWNQSTMKGENNWHPLTFSYSDVSPQRIKEIKDINHVYYDSEFRTERCRSNSTSVPCFLFARKFSRGAAMRLLSEDVVGSFETSTLLDTDQ